MLRRSFLRERPLHFKFNPYSPLANGLVFAGLGNAPGGWEYGDSSLHRNAGLLTNMDPSTDWQWSAELGRWVLRVTSDNQWVNCGNSPTLAGFDDFSVSLWGALSDPGQNVVYIVSRYMTTGNQRSWAFCTTSLSNRPLGFRYSADGTSLTDVALGSRDLLDATWHHYAIARTGSLLSFYYDGRLYNTANVPGTLFAATSNTTIGGRDTGVSSVLGQTADPLIFNRALTPAEIQALARRDNTMLSVGGSPLILPPRRRLWAVSGVTPLSLTGASVQLESPYAVDDAVATAAASGGTPGYTYTITSQVKA